MQAGSFVTSTSSPPSTSTRNIALGAGSQVDRQWSLDVERSLISISGSFTQAQGLGVCQVSGKPPGGSPWTQVAAGPPRSPRQRTLSPMRMANGQAARVLSREVVDDRYMEAERLLQKSREVPRAPFLGMTSSQLSRQDDDLHIDGGLDRFRGRVSPAAVLSASHRVQPRQSLLTTAAAKSPRQRPLSPRGLRPGPDRTPPVAQRVHPGDADDHYFSKSQIAAFPSTFWISACTHAFAKPTIASSPMVVESKDSEESSVVIPSGLAHAENASTKFFAVPAAADIGESVGVHRLSVVPAMRSTDDAEVARRRELSPAPWPAPAAFAREQKQAREECPARVLSKEEAQALSRGKSPSVDATSAPLPAPTVAAQSPTPPGQKDVEVLEPVDRGWVPSAEELKPWLEAAKEFNMNSDFEISAPEGCDFAALMHIMKKESAGKWTIQAMADKLLLNGILENLGLPHMPMIFANRSPHKLRERLEILVDKLIIATGKKQPYDIIVKPTHLSSAMGVLSFDKVHAPHREETLRQLEEHMRKYLEAHAHKQESLALQSLKPGFIGQPKYKSVVGFKAPLELKVCALWGKARTGVWWWGTRAAGPAQVPHRNVWLTRKPAVLGELSDDDTWEVLHNHPGGNVGWENAVKIFQKNMPAMAALTEQLAVALGTPFLRADFFVGSSKWGVRLNEVAYGCGLEYRKLLQEGATECVVDDKPAMVEILRQGMALCSTRLPAQQFLERLGVQGTEYADSAVNALKAPLTTWASTLALEIDEELPELAAEECLCKSVKELPLQPPQQSQLIEQTLLHPQQLEQVREIRHVIKPHPPQIPTLPMLTLQNLAVRQPGQAKVFSSAQCSVPATSLRLHAPASHKANRRTSACGITIPPPRAAPVLVRVPVAR
eukprot:CAMPEP_0169411872 /NCGR_PEP_ID=MMETSP1017-20121227/60527_1 /TAXON_ID=342587 /ORGANISM="Karlodinium micrum, Strain CCMP2283" /LENGTH=892 /DNA_ID=CAMNT_0009519195 /DNA_START=85 /DNA_END=2765 /DNA_ORIENTATION=+